MVRDAPVQPLGSARELARALALDLMHGALKFAGLFAWVLFLPVLAGGAIQLALQSLGAVDRTQSVTNTVVAAILFPAALISWYRSNREAFAAWTVKRAVFGAVAERVEQFTAAMGSKRIAVAAETLALALFWLATLWLKLVLAGLLIIAVPWLAERELTAEQLDGISVGVQLLIMGIYCVALVCGCLLGQRWLLSIQGR